MKGLIAAAAFLALSGGVASAGCLTGAAVGAVVGHEAGHHAVLGGAAGCAVGHHEASVKMKEEQKQAQKSDQKFERLIQRPKGPTGMRAGLVWRLRAKPIRYQRPAIPEESRLRAAGMMT